MDRTSKSGGKLRLLAMCVLVGIVLWGTQDYWSPLFANANVATSEKPEKKKSPSRAVPVIVEPIGETEDTVIIDAIGTARARNSVMLFAAAAGEIMSLPVVAGDTVKKNQVLMRLDSRDAELLVRVAATRVKEAQNTLDRAKRLRDNNVRSRANVEDAEVILERAKLELSQAREALADRTMRAPFDGIVGIPRYEQGDRITTSSELLTIDDRSELLVEFDVAERHLGRLALELPVVGRSSSFPDTDINGKVERIDSRVDATSRTVRVRAAFPNTNDLLRPGMSIVINLYLPGPTLPSVPELALQWQNGESFIWRIVDGKAQKIRVISKRRLNNKVLIEGDVKLGDLVVVEGVQRLRDGRAVEISAAEGS